MAILNLFDVPRMGWSFLSVTFYFFRLKTVYIEIIKMFYKSIS